jgi:ribonuclease HI
MSLKVYCDGACQPNPGRGGWGFVVYLDGKELHTQYGGAPATTNQRMELTGALMAIRWLTANAEDVPARLFSDSLYTVKGCNEWRHAWKRKGRLKAPSTLANLDLWLELDAALAAFPIRLKWVKGHAGIRGNVRADALSWDGFRTAGAA